MMKVLVAEDDLTSRTIITAILKKWGYGVEVATDGHQALEMLNKPGAPKLALLDWSMPGLSGIEVCEKLRKDHRNDTVYIIILTSKGEKENIVKGLDSGANDYIVKPYNNDELHARIKVGRRMIEIQSELEAAKNALIHEALHDSLTGVLNRRAIITSLNKELSRIRRNNSSLCIGMCDLDHFKKINDEYGHQTGDDVLIEFTKIVRNNLREYDIIGRYGGEEFLILTPECEDSCYETVFQRLCDAVAESKISTRSGDLSITVSIGVAYATGESKVDELLSKADAALYEAKGLSRNRVCFADAACEIS